MTQHLEMSYSQLIQKLVRNKAACTSCGWTVSPEDMRVRIDTDMPGDLHITLYGFNGKPLWIYMHCPRCDYQAALWKMVKDMTVRRSREM